MTKPVRPYQPVTPANNKYLAKRWDQEIFNTHRKKVAAAKAVIDNMPPRVHMHLHIKLKKLQFEAERLATIERDNRILLEKMAHIMRTGGLVDHKKLDYTTKSLNKTKRQRELLRISHENLAILKRLTTKDPHYNHSKWLMEWQVNQQYLMNISKYPHPWRQEQSPYQSQSERKTAANKLVNKGIKLSDRPPKAAQPPPNNDKKMSRVGQTLDLLAHLVPTVNKSSTVEGDNENIDISHNVVVKPKVPTKQEVKIKTSSLFIDAGKWEDVGLPVVHVDSDGKSRTDCSGEQPRGDGQCEDEFFIKVTSVESEYDRNMEHAAADTDAESVKSVELTSVISEELLECRDS